MKTVNYKFKDILKNKEFMVCFDSEETMMKLYNTLTGKKEVLNPIIPGKLGIYVCGLTVYDEAHIGHLRCMLVFDLLVRFLRHTGYAVNYVRNITDVDDKIIRRANEEGITPQALTTRVIAGIQEQEKALGLVTPDHEPKASEYMQEMIDMIQALERQGIAYVSKAGDVCFAVEKFPEYGALSGQSVQQLLSGHRVDAEEKNAAADFVLWKMAKPGEPSWPSPWGDGRPGWHIECSAMSTKILGDTFDLHGGGIDLKFPHHENEIAQSVCATKGTFARHWMHVGHLHVDSEKMSKSLGNFVTIQQALNQYHPDVLKLFLLKTHYSQPFNYLESGMLEAQKVLLSFYLALAKSKDTSDFAEDAADWVMFTEALKDDLAVSKALALMHAVSGRLVEGSAQPGDRSLLIAMGGVFGILMQEPMTYLQGSANVSEVNDLLAQRTAARKQKDYAAADSIRDTLAERGIDIEDRVDGVFWYDAMAGILTE